MQIIHSDTKTEQLSSEINEIKAWFENNAHASNLTNCNSNRNFQPRWNRSRDGGDRLEFDIFEDGKIPMPKLSGTGLKSGRMKFVSKKNNGNGNANGQGMIVSFIPFQSFTGDISKVSTSNFRIMNFDGIIAFDELNGCSGNAYKVDKGVVMNKLTIAIPNQLNPRCGEAYITTTDYYTMVSSPAYPQNGCTVSFAYSSQSTIYGVPCLDTPGSGGNYGSSSASGYDATYNDFLAGYTVNAMNRICSTTFQFQRVVDPTAQNTRLEAGMRNDGINFTVPASSTYTGDRSFGFNYVLFGLPEFATNFQQGVSLSDAASIVSGAINQAVIAIQQDISINGIITTGNSVGGGGITTSNGSTIPLSPVLSDNFWLRVNINISNSLGINPITNTVLKTYTQRQSGGTVYTTPNSQNPTQTIVFNIPVTAPGCQ